MKESVKVTIITAISAIVVAIITGVFGLLSKSNDGTPTKSPTVSPSPLPIQQASSSDGKLSEPQNKRDGSNNPAYEMYDEEAEVEEGHSYTDKETGFVFAVDQISTGLFGERSGALSRYTLPDGAAKRPYRLRAGHRVQFEYRGRKFFMVMEDIDYARRVSKIRIKEIPI
jgi:hypothetical protein